MLISYKFHFIEIWFDNKHELSCALSIKKETPMEVEMNVCIFMKFYSILVYVHPFGISAFILACEQASRPRITQTVGA